MATLYFIRSYFDAFQSCNKIKYIFSMPVSFLASSNILYRNCCIFSFIFSKTSPMQLAIAAVFVAVLVRRYLYSLPASLSLNWLFNNRRKLIRYTEKALMLYQHHRHRNFSSKWWWEILSSGFEKQASAFNRYCVFFVFRRFGVMIYVIFSTMDKRHIMLQILQQNLFMRSFTFAGHSLLKSYDFANLMCICTSIWFFFACDQNSSPLFTQNCLVKATFEKMYNETKKNNNNKTHQIHIIKLLKAVFLLTEKTLCFY